MKDVEPTDLEIDAVIARGPAGTFAVAGLATAVVLGLYLAFYVLVYLPRGIVG